MAGTVCHQMSAELLQAWVDGGSDQAVELDAQPYLHRRMLFWTNVLEEIDGEDWEDAFLDDLGLAAVPPPGATFTSMFVVSQEMVDAVNSGVTFVQDRVIATGGHLEIEQRVPIGHFTGEAGATGSADIVLLYGETSETMDFKYGRHKVFAYETLQPARGETPPVLRMNLQLACYNLGSYEKFSLLYEIKRVKAIIIQPFLNHLSEYECSIEELLDLRDNYLAVKAEETRTSPVFKPTYDNCHYCKARDPDDVSRRCEARTKAVLALATQGFDDVGEVQAPPVPAADDLGRLYHAIPFIREWCDDISQRVFRELQAGKTVRRHDGLAYVLKQGRKGDRVWADPEAVEKFLRNKARLRKEEMYTMKLIGPAAVEKMAPKVRKRKPTTPPPETKINALQWRKLQAFIKQADGGMTVALETDSRPTLPSAVDGFDEVVGDDDVANALGL